MIQCKDTTSLQTALAQQPSALILDLHNPTLDLSVLLAALTSEPKPKVVAFGSHVDAARLKAARQAGCAEVLPRSAFFERLSEFADSFRNA